MEQMSTKKPTVILFTTSREDEWKMNKIKALDYLKIRTL